MIERNRAKKRVVIHFDLDDVLGILIEKLQDFPFLNGCLISTRSRTLEDACCGISIPLFDGNTCLRNQWAAVTYPFSHLLLGRL